MAELPLFLHQHFFSQGHSFTLKHVIKRLQIFDLNTIMHSLELSVDQRGHFQGVLKFEMEIMSFK